MTAYFRTEGNRPLCAFDVPTEVQALSSGFSYGWDVDEACPPSLSPTLSTQPTTSAPTPFMSRNLSFSLCTSINGCKARHTTACALVTPHNGTLCYEKQFETAETDCSSAMRSWTRRQLDDSSALEAWEKCECEGTYMVEGTVGCGREQQLTLSFVLGWLALAIAMTAPFVLLMRGHVFTSSDELKDKFYHWIAILRDETEQAHLQESQKPEEPEDRDALVIAEETWANLNEVYFVVSTVLDLLFFVFGRFLRKLVLLLFNVFLVATSMGEPQYVQHVMDVIVDAIARAFETVHLTLFSEFVRWFPSLFKWLYFSFAVDAIGKILPFNRTTLHHILCCP